MLPFVLAQRLGLAQGTILVIDQETDETTYIRVQQISSTLVDKGGILVIRATSNDLLQDTLYKDREQHLDTLGNGHCANLA